MLRGSGLPRVCMGGSMLGIYDLVKTWSAPRVHGWFLNHKYALHVTAVCPACAWVVPSHPHRLLSPRRLPRVCMGGSGPAQKAPGRCESAPRVHGWFQRWGPNSYDCSVCPACAWVVPGSKLLPREVLRLPRVCMGGSETGTTRIKVSPSVLRVNGCFLP